MTTIILITALSQLPLELHVNHSSQGRYIVACLSHDIRVIDEDTSAARYYQHELRRVVRFRDSIDVFCQIGQQRRKLPAMAFDSHRMMILSLKASIDDWNDVGSAAYPWQQGYTLTAFKPPAIHEQTDFGVVSGVAMENPLPPELEIEE